MVTLVKDGLLVKASVPPVIADENEVIAVAFTVSEPVRLVRADKFSVAREVHEDINIVPAIPVSRAKAREVNEEFSIVIFLPVGKVTKDGKDNACASVILLRVR